MNTVTGKELKAIAKLTLRKPEPHRSYLSVVWMDSDPSGSARLWATNGNHLISKTFNHKGPDTPQAYSAEHINRLGAREEVFVVQELEHECLRDVKEELELRDPPDVDMVVPAIRSEAGLACSIFGVTAKLLIEGMKAFDALAPKETGEFHLDEGELGPIVVTNVDNSVKYVLMPRRTGKEVSVSNLTRGINLAA